MFGKSRDPSALKKILIDSKRMFVFSFDIHHMLVLEWRRGRYAQCGRMAHRPAAAIENVRETVRHDAGAEWNVNMGGLLAPKNQRNVNA